MAGKMAEKCICWQSKLQAFFALFIISHMIACQNLTETKYSASLGYIWENPRYENHNAEEVSIDETHSVLRLTCILNPPLPVTQENFFGRDNIVKWMNIHKTHSRQITRTFWSDDQTVTAISLPELSLRDLGTYGCSYRTFLKTLNITVSDIKKVKILPEPTQHADLEGAALNMKDSSGLDNWKSFTLNQEDNHGMNFPCKITPQRAYTPNSVHQLQPADIDIILSLGGAISAGVAENASTVSGLFSSHKSLSFSIGGKFPLENLVTLPSILKKFNPAMKGAVVLEEEFSTLLYDTSLRHLPSRVKALIKKLENRKDIDFRTSWKLLTLSLDFADFCVACKIRAHWDERIKAVTESLDMLYAKVPRLFINLVLPPNITQLYQLDSSKNCETLYRKPCACLESSSNEDKTAVSQMVNELSSHMTNVVQKYNTKSDFAVVIQPFWSNIDTDNLNLFAKDCYHLSLTGHEFIAVNLWNNMLQPVGLKSKTWNMNKGIRCPTENHPYLFTAVNSKGDAVLDFSMDAEPQNNSPAKSSSKLKIALGIGLTSLVVIIVVVVVVYLRRQRRIPLSARIRILAQPWKRMKEKI